MKSIHHTERQTELIEKLRKLDTNRVPFFAARQQLLDEGYTEHEIATALYSFSYDGIPNKISKADPVTKYYTENPQDAEKVAGYIVKHMKDGEVSKKVAYALAARYAPGYHAKAQYGVKFADEIEYPFFTALFATGVSMIVVISNDLPTYYVLIGPAIVTLYWIVSQILKRR